MSNKLLCFLTITISAFSQTSCMLPVATKTKPLIQCLPTDSLWGVQLHSDIHTLGRMKRVCHYFNEATNIEIIVLSNPSCHDFKSVEKFLYRHIPKVLLLIGDHAQQLRARYADLINTHQQKIDSSIECMHTRIKCGDYKDFFVDNLELTDDDRISFYGGKLPGHIKCVSSSSSDELYDEDGELDEFKDFNHILNNILGAAHQDACYAAKNGNIARLKVVLDRYEQFPNYYELLEPLCKLGNSTLVWDYLSIPERGIDYTEEIGSLTALELAELYQNDELGQFLLEQAHKKLLEKKD